MAITDGTTIEPLSAPSVLSAAPATQPTDSPASTAPPDSSASAPPTNDTAAMPVDTSDLSEEALQEADLAQPLIGSNRPAAGGGGDPLAPPDPSTAWSCPPLPQTPSHSSHSPFDIFSDTLDTVKQAVSTTGNGLSAGAQDTLNATTYLGDKLIDGEQRVEKDTSGTPVIGWVAQQAGPAVRFGVGFGDGAVSTLANPVNDLGQGLAHPTDDHDALSFNSRYASNSDVQNGESWGGAALFAGLAAGAGGGADDSGVDDGEGAPESAGDGASTSGGAVVHAAPEIPSEPTGDAAPATPAAPGLATAPDPLAGLTQDTLFHSTTSRAMPGIVEAGKLVPASQLPELGIERASGEGPIYSMGNAPKSFISAGQGSKGLGTALAYADQYNTSAAYNPALLSDGQLNTQISLLQTALDNGGGPPGTIMTTAKIDARLTELQTQQALREDGVSEAPYPVMLQMSGDGLSVRSTSNLPGEVKINGSVPLSNNLQQVFAPSARLAAVQNYVDSIAPGGNVAVTSFEDLEAAAAKESDIIEARSYVYNGLNYNEAFFQNWLATVTGSSGGK